MPGTKKIVEQVASVLDDSERISNYCVEIMTELGFHWESEALWEILLGTAPKIVDHEIHDLVDMTLEETERDKKIVNEIIQGLAPRAGADSEQQKDVWYVLWGQEGEVQEPPEVRPAQAKELVMARYRVAYDPAWDAMRQIPQRLTSYEQAWELVRGEMKRIAEETVGALRELAGDAAVEITVSDVDEYLGDEYGYDFRIEFVDEEVEDEGIGIDFHLIDSGYSEGIEEGEEGWGVNASMDFTGYPSGRMLGGLTPHNYTPQVWTDDPKELKQRLSYFDPAEAAFFLIENAINREIMQGERYR